MELFLRGLTYHDEGQIVYAAHQFLIGLYPYKDFHFIYTPGSIFITSVWFSLFHESLLSGRMLIFFTIALSTFILFRIIRPTANSLLVSSLSCLLFFSWALHINFPWPTTFAVLFGLFAVLMTQEKKYILTGGAIALTLLSKQNFGLAIILSYFLFFLILRSSFSKKIILQICYGFFLPLIIFYVYLLATGSVTPFLQDMYRFSIEKIMFEGVLTTPFWYGPQSLFYLVFPFTSLTVFFLLFRSKRIISLLLLPNLFAILFYLFGIRPTTDYVHLVSLFGLIAIPLASLSYLLKTPMQKNAIVLFSIVLIAFGFYTAYFKGYYRWEAPLVSQNNYLDLQKAHIYTDIKYPTLLPPLIKEIQRYTRSDEYIFVYDYAPLLYFLSGRENATKWNILQSSFLGNDDEKEVVRDLEEKNVRIIVTTIPITLSQNTIIEKYILRNYKPKESYGEFTMYVYR